MGVRDDRAAYKVRTRGRAGIYKFFPYLDKPLTVDGLSVYEIFDILQRCWAHILRESKRLARNGEPEMAALYDASETVPQCKMRGRESGECATASQQHGDARHAHHGQDKELGHSFGAILANAAPNMFMFMLYP